MSGRSALVRRKGNNLKGKGVDIPAHHTLYHQHSSTPLAYEQQHPLHQSPSLHSGYSHYAQQPIPGQHPCQCVPCDHAHLHGVDHASVSAASFSGHASLGTGIAAPSGRFLQFSRTEYSVPYSGTYPPQFPHACGTGSETTGALSSSEGGPSMYHPFPAYQQWGSGFYPESLPCCSYHHPFGSPPASQVARTEDTSGIEKSHLRAALDKRSDDVRKGLAKTFAFRKKSLSHKAVKLVDNASSPATGSERQEPYSDVDGSNGSERVYPAVHDALAATNAVHRQGAISSSETDPLAARLAMGSSGFAVPPGVDEYDSSFSGLRITSPAKRPVQMTSDTDNSQRTSSPLASAARKPEHDPALKPEGIGPESLPKVMKWMGHGTLAVRWNKLQRDPELWDPDGDVLVYLHHEGEKAHPSPSFRLSSHVIDATGSSYFMKIPKERTDGASTRRGHEASSLDDPQPTHPPGAKVVNRRQDDDELSASEDQMSPKQIGSDSTVLFEMYLPPPSDLSTAETLRHDLATRNVFAMLYHASIIGTTLCTALTDVLERLESAVAPGSDNLGLVLCHLLCDGMDDVRGNASTAISLLAFCEHPHVRWEEGWLEFFTHAVGMIASSSASTEEIVSKIEDYQRVSLVTRSMMDRAILDMQVRIQVAETRMADFALRDVFRSQKGNEEANMTMAKAAAARFRDMLVQHYTRMYGSWPPVTTPINAAAPSSTDGCGATNMTGVGSNEGILWLSRPIAMTLARDFGLLWEHLVDREVVWAASKTEEGRERMIDMRRDSDGGQDISATEGTLVSDTGEFDMEGLAVTEMLLRFDASNRYSHIPHPFPLVPDLDDSRYAELGKDEALERNVRLAYVKATNTSQYTLAGSHQRPSASSSNLVDAYLEFEKNDCLSQVDPRIGRLGRWVVIYGVLQTLAEVSVDAAWLRWKDGVRYQLGVRLGGKGMLVPPWKPATADAHGSAKTTAGMGPVSIIGRMGGEHERSWCWEAADRWARETARPARVVDVGNEAMYDTGSKARKQERTERSLMKGEEAGMLAQNVTSRRSSESSDSSSTDAEFELPSEWDFLSRKDTLNRGDPGDKVFKRSPRNVPFMAEAVSLRGDSPTLTA